ncbi:nitroreductase family protein [bacterium]|nr:nitroreductase family protein [bacterium]
MQLLINDESTCKKDGICANECPVAIIRLKDGNGFPEMVQGGEGICLLCGHCVAVCPQGALSHIKVPIEECPPILKEVEISEEQAIQFLRSRRSVRFFKNRPVEKEKIQRLIEAARYAPTGSNSQSIEWTVFTDKTEIRNLAGLTVEWMKNVREANSQAIADFPYIPMIIAAWEMGMDVVLREAPALIIASAPQKNTSGMTDLSISLSYLDLIAPKLGLGTCWAGLLQGGLTSWKPLKDAVGLPEGHSQHYPMMLGYSKYKYFRLPERKLPKINWK